jgi:hypothetical protein
MNHRTLTSDDQAASPSANGRFGRRAAAVPRAPDPLP